MSRPTKLTEELVIKAQAYLDEITMSVGTLLPTIEGLAIKLKITRETLYQWEKENDSFSDILSSLRQHQAEKLIQNSLLNRYNPTISKMMLSKHGYVEKNEVDAKIEQVTPILGGLAKDVQPHNDDKETR